MEDVLCPVVFPVHGIDVPLHRITAGFLDEPDSRVVIVSVFKTKQRRFRIGKAINSLCEIFQCERLFPDGKGCTVGAQPRKPNGGGAEGASQAIRMRRR